MNETLAKSSDIINIVYEDNDVVVLNKPAGIVVHPDAHHHDGSLVDELIKIRPEIKNVGEPACRQAGIPERPGVVHRLDKDTSGVLIVAKNQAAFEYLKKLFQEHQMIKTYTALVAGIVKNDNGIIDLPIGRSKNDPTKRAALGKMRGKVRTAITRYKVLERFADYTLIEAMPETGRTHQIRVHLKAIGHPLACDKLYAGKLFRCPFGLERHFLHASSLELTLPSGSHIKLEAEPTADLGNVIAGLRKQKTYDKNY